MPPPSPAFLPYVFILQLPRDVFRLAFPVGLNDLQSSLVLPNSVDLTLESGFLSLAAWMSDYHGDGSFETAGGNGGAFLLTTISFGNADSPSTEKAAWRERATLLC